MAVSRLSWQVMVRTDDLKIPESCGLAHLDDGEDRAVPFYP